jgi:hypothetical protein
VATTAADEPAIALLPVPAGIALLLTRRRRGSAS